MRLTQTILRLSLARVPSDQIQLLRIYDTISTLVISLVSLLRMCCAQVLACEISDTPCCDMRTGISALAAQLVTTDPSMHTPVYIALVNATACAIEDIDLLTRDDPIGLLSAKDACKYYIQLLELLTVEDDQGLFENRLLRKFRRYDELERELWSLGIIKSWITFK